MEEKKKNYLLYKVIVVILVLVLIIISSFIININKPYHDHSNDLNEIRDKIIKKGNYKYDNYFYEYNGNKTYYIMKVKKNNKSYYVAYDKNLKLVDSYKNKVTNKKYIIKKINDTYKINIDDIYVIYEDEFLYYGSYMNNDHIYYYFYSIDDGKFIKSYNL